MLITALAFVCQLAFAEATRAEVVLDDGQVLKGLVEKEADGSVVITLGSGSALRFPAAIVREVRPITATPLPLPAVTPGVAINRPSTDPNAPWDPDPNKSRYLYSPSAFGLGQGKGYVAQKQLLLTEAAIGVTDWWDIQAGTSVITLFIPDAAFAIVGTKVSFKVAKDVHLALGGQSLFVGEGIVGLGFGTVTYGTADRHVSLSAGGLAGSFNGSVESVGTVLVTLSGNYRLGPRTALVSENWFLIGGELQPAGGGLFVVPSLAVRMFGPSFATDLGLVPIITGDSSLSVIPIPWVGFTWNYAIGKKG